ncbi:O-antigen ligase family protein [Agromyces lapidis]|uniref:O-antigen ligase family protein n=1 Tax=Agromyces lapidis TaxID=279574 RepID=A0ABV5SNT7_9MICO|nr:O-antigen ligase family protein [Agromyces lapidis]
MTATDRAHHAEALPAAGYFRSEAEPRGGLDAGWFFGAYVVAVMALPSNLTIPALGAAGQPSSVIGLIALVWWIGAQLNRSSATLAPAQPVRRALLVFAVAVLASYVAATTRPIEALELSGADRGLLQIASLLGVALLASDGLVGLRRMESPLRLLVFLGGVVGVIGILQFATGAALVDVIQIPGLSPNTDLTSVYDRGGFNRAAGTSIHPLEFGVLLSMVLPLALHFAILDTHRSLVLRWFPVAAIAIAVPITVSRSAVLAVVVVLVIVLPTWPRVRRRVAYGAIGALLVFVYVAIPGMLGTLTRLFTGISDDGSARSRTDSYALAWEFIEKHPFFGRGFSTFLPQYRILDNQYLGLLIELGVIGTAAFVGLLVVVMRTAVLSRRGSADPRTRSLAQALLALVAAAACGFATFDAFGFPQVTAALFLGIGAIGALSNTMRQESLLSAPIGPSASAAGERAAGRPAGRRTSGPS